MRVALIGDALSANVMDWASALSLGGADVHVLTLAATGEEETAVTRLRTPNMLGHRAAYIWAARAARTILRQLNPDVVIGYYVTGYGTTARLTGFSPLVQVPVGNDVLVNPSGTLLHHITRKNLRAADLVVTWAPHLAAGAVGFGVHEDRLIIRPRGVDIDNFAFPAGTSGADSRRLLATRALDGYYRHDVLIDALSRLPTDVTLTFAGDGPARPALARHAAATDVADRVRFLGRVSRQELPAVLRDHGTYVSACPTDGVSASLLEAMAAGLYPVVADHEANRWWLEDGQNGRLAAPEPGAFSRVVLEAIECDRRDATRDANLTLVRERADLHRNAQLFLDDLSRLAHRGPRLTDIG